MDAELDELHRTMQDAITDREVASRVLLHATNALTEARNREWEATNRVIRCSESLRFYYQSRATKEPPK